jgi:hypothetical protein
MDDPRYSPVRPIDPHQPVTVDLASFGPRRIRWGQDTPQWVRANGFRPDRGLPAVAEASILSMYGDWWVYCRTNLTDTRGRVLREVGLLLPSDCVTTAM